MKVSSIALGALALAWLAVAGVGSAAGREAVPVLIAQGTPGPGLGDALRSQIDQTVQQAVAATAGGDAKTIGQAVASAISAILAANAADPALATAIAQEAMASAAALLGANGAALVQVAAAVAVKAAAAAPTAAASIFVAVSQLLPADLQDRANETLIAQAIDSALPGAQVTASVTGLLGGLGNAPNGPQQIGTLTPLLAILDNLANVTLSQH